jgi:regulation of enolase protein 1 (concanavalin A-like superfamily)
LVAAAGAGVSSNSDQFTLVSADITGDLQITARVIGSESARPRAQYGIMVREGTEPADRNVFVALRPRATNELAVQFRANQSGLTTVLPGTPVAESVWLRLTRLGNVFSAFYSTNGRSWIALESALLPMNAAVQAGFAVASGETEAAATAEFDRILIEPLNATFSEWQAWVLSRRGVHDSDAGLAADPDADGRSNVLEHLLGSDPLAADQAQPMEVAGLGADFVRLRVEERKNAAALGREFLHSADLSTWNPITPDSNTIIHDKGSVVVREIRVPITTTTGFYLSRYE